MQLVNWDGKRFRNGAGLYPTDVALLDAIAKVKRPKELSDLIDALGEMWKKIGASANCKTCFEGKLQRPKQVHGCCGSCLHLGDTGCIAKPLGCALYSCGQSHLGKRGDYREGMIFGQLNQLKCVLCDAGIPVLYFSHGFFAEAAHKFTPAQIAVLKAVTKSLRAIW